MYESVGTGMVKVLPFIAGVAELNLRYHTIAFIFDCGGPGTNFKVRDRLGTYPALMGTWKRENQVVECWPHYQ